MLLPEWAMKEINMVLRSFYAFQEVLGSTNHAWQPLISSYSALHRKGGIYLRLCSPFINKLEISIPWKKPAVSQLLHTTRDCSACVCTCVRGEGRVTWWDLVGPWGQLGTPVSHAMVALGERWIFFNVMCPVPVRSGTFFFCVTMWCCRKSFGQRDKRYFISDSFTVTLSMSLILFELQPRFIDSLYKK